MCIVSTLLGKMRIRVRAGKAVHLHCDRCKVGLSGVCSTVEEGQAALGRRRRQHLLSRSQREHYLNIECQDFYRNKYDTSRGQGRVWRHQGVLCRMSERQGVRMSG